MGKQGECCGHRVRLGKGKKEKHGGQARDSGGGWHRGLEKHAAKAARLGRRLVQLALVLGVPHVSVGEPCGGQEGLEQLQVLLEAAVQSSLCTESAIEVKEVNGAVSLSACRMHAMRLANSMKPPDAIRAAEKQQAAVSGGVGSAQTDELSFAVRQILGGKHDSDPAKNKGHRRLQAVEQSKEASTILRALASKADAGTLDIDDFSTAGKASVEVAALLQHSNLTSPPGASEGLHTLWECAKGVQRALVSVCARELERGGYIPTGGDGAGLAEAALYGTLNKLDLATLYTPKVKRELFGASPSKAASKKKAEAADPEDALSMCMTGFEYALRKLSPHDETVESVLPKVRNQISEKKREGASTREASNEILSTLVNE